VLGYTGVKPLADANIEVVSPAVLHFYTSPDDFVAAAQSAVAAAAPSHPVSIMVI